MKNILTIFLLLTCGLCFGQNLVVNGDFEQFDTCPRYGGELYRAIHWINPQPATSPDYYNACQTNWCCGVPSNILGYEYAHSGSGYAIVASVTTGPGNPPLTLSYREYIETQLTDTLVGGQSYCIKFFVSACDSLGQVCDNLGMYFSKTLIVDSCHRCVLPYTPQFENTSAILNSRIGWTEISGIYVATGGEKFIVIGNFRDSSTVIATPTGWTNASCSSCQYQSAYYVDDVSVSPDLLNCNSVGIQQTERSNSVKCFPNPFSTQLTFSLADNVPTTVSLYNFLGQQILQQTFTNFTTINTAQLADGIYFYELRNSKGTLKTGKLVKQ